MHIVKVAIGIVALAIGLPGAAFADEACAALVAKLGTLDLTQGTDLVDSKVNATYKSLYDTCDSKNTFNGTALPLLSGKPLKCSTDKNRVDFVKKFTDGTIVFRSKAGVDADGSPVSQSPNASPADQPHTSLTYDGTPTEYVNAEAVPFVVTPLASTKYKSAFPADSGIGLGDLAVVINNGRCSFGLVADEGPAYRIGEASLKVHEDLGNPQCKTPGEYPCTKLKGGGNGVGIGAGVTYILFPGTKPSPLKSDTVVSVTAAKGAEKAKAFLDKFQK